ncbi:MAG: dCMP deaminase family protein [Candidatus Magasanikbacteria bacterium]
MEKSREDYISWDECFMRMSYVIAERSKDPSTQVGAVIINEQNVVVGMGYNGFPRGIENEDLPWDRTGDLLDTKYPYVVHAESNAIFNSNSNTKDCRIYVKLFPCNECAKAIIQNGIKEVVFESDKYHDEDIFTASRKLFDRAGIKYRQYISQWSQEKSV